MKFRSLVALSGFGLANVVPANALHWVRSTNKDTCVGIEVPCRSLESCTKVAVGPCASAATGPAWYTTSVLEGMAVLDDGYLYANGTANMSKVDIISIYPGPNNGYRDFKNHTDYANVMTGAFVGFANGADSGGFVGVGSALCKKATGITANTYPLYHGSNKDALRVDRSAETTGSNSPVGAPLGPDDVCMSPTTTPNQCGPDITYNDGDYKFNIYGKTLGANFQGPRRAFFGVRLKLQIHNAANAAVYFNGDTSKTITNLGNTDVTSMFVTFTSNGTEEALSITFPSKYNIGTTASPNPTESKDVKIRISPQGVNGLWVDYLFDASDFQTKDKWFLYDPTMVAGDKATVSAAAASQNSANSGGGGGNSSSSSQASSASSIRNGIVAFVTAALVSSWASTL